MPFGTVQSQRLTITTLKSYDIIYMQSLTIKKKIFHLTINIEIKHCNEAKENADARLNIKENISLI